ARGRPRDIRDDHRGARRRPGRLHPGRLRLRLRPGGDGLLVLDAGALGRRPPRRLLLADRPGDGPSPPQAVRCPPRHPLHPRWPPRRADRRMAAADGRSAALPGRARRPAHPLVPGDAACRPPAADHPWRPLRGWRCRLPRRHHGRPRRPPRPHSDPLVRAARLGPGDAAERLSARLPQHACDDDGRLPADRHRLRPRRLALPGDAAHRHRHGAARRRRLPPPRRSRLPAHRPRPAGGLRRGAAGRQPAETARL
ncbi:MAG: putative inner membrane protein, partial [uncultured Craurococcus sp.]